MTTEATARPRRARPHVAVVGGGISGLAAAWRLATLPDPPQVTVLEQASAVGGKLLVGEVGGLMLDLGAEAVLARRGEATALMTEVGLGGDLVHPATSAASVLRAGRGHPLPAGTLMGVPAAPERLRGLLTAAEVARAAAERDLPAPALESDVDVASWVAGRFGPAVLERLVEPLLGGVYAGHADRLSLQATMPQVWALARRGGSVLRALAGSAGAVAATGSAAPAPVFAGLVGGVGRLPTTLAARLAERGVELRTGVTVRALERTAGGWRLVTGPVPAPWVLEVDAVVLAVPATPAARLLAACSPAASARLGEVEAASMAVVSAVLPRAATPPLAGSGLLVPPVEGLAVKAVTYSSAKWSWVGALDPGLVVVRMSVGRLGEEAVLQRDDAELTALAVGELSGVLGGRVRPVATRVTRWGGALPQYAVGHVPRMAAVRAEVGRLPGVAICGAAFDGLGVPACIAAAGSAAAQVAAHLAGGAPR